MKLEKLFSLAALGSVLALTIVGCARTPVGPTPIPGGRYGPPQSGTPIGESAPFDTTTNVVTTTHHRQPPPPVVPEPVAPTPSNPSGDQSLSSAKPIGLGDGTGGTDLSKPNTFSAPTGPVAPVDPNDFANWTADSETLKLDTVYFDYDKSAIRSSEESKLKAVAEYWKGNSENTAIKVEGNCDERGTEEYNRSLGERRALAAREYLAGLGVDPKRIVTITYGKDKPADLSHNEEAWSKNRRDDFVVLTRPKP